MLEVKTLNNQHIDSIAEYLKRDQLFYKEYSFINDEQLKELYINKLRGAIEKSDSYIFVALSKGEISGVLLCLKEEFDSENFGFACFRITDLLVFKDNYDEIFEIVWHFINELEDKLSEKYNPFHFTISLSNNVSDSGKIFNSLSRCGLFYIHTLLTFCSHGKRVVNPEFEMNGGIKIRTVLPEDAAQISDLAESSFRLSRFHMDPFLDNIKANRLLKESAMNSVLRGFVDIMFVAEDEGKIVGYYSGKKKYIKEFNLNIGEAVISAVDKHYRGKGIFSLLDSHLLNWFADNTDFAEMGTYLANDPVHKTWIGKGLELIRGTHQFSKFHNK
jgi:GNAT superfamily N-acetyltransferase